MGARIEVVVGKLSLASEDDPQKLLSCAWRPNGIVTVAAWV